MKRTLLVILLLSISLLALNKGVLKWEKLAECLPQMQKVSGLLRAEVTGDNEPDAFVSLLYYNSAEIMERSKEVHIIIEDQGGHKEYIEEALSEAPDISKPILIDGKYKGIKIISFNGSVIEYCTYHIVVANRFLITLSSTTEGDLTKEIEALIDNFDFNKMEKLK